MGKKIREEREKKRESYAEKRSREKRKTTLIAGGIIAGVALVLGYSGYVFYTNASVVPGGPPGAGPLGDEHEHAAMSVLIFGDQFDFSSPAYQVKSSYIHFEDNNGETVHRHASNVTMGYLFDTINIGLTDKCFVFPDKREFCNNEQYGLKFFVNHEPLPDLRNYVLHEDDRILVSYGNENSTKIEEQLVSVDAISIHR